MGIRVIGSAGGALEEALNFLFARTTGGVKFGLERTSALLAALGNPHRSYPVIHVAGTNGKGSSLATAEALLRGRGMRVGKYTSPHLVDFRERILVDRVPIEADAVVEFVERWTPLVEQLGATFFEATTALAFDAFARAGVDVALIETGLGGRLDSTNVVDPVSAGVTCIGWDHMEYLGHTLDAIAMEKAGIFKPGRPAVIGDANPAIRDRLERRARELGAEPLLVSTTVTVEDIEVSTRGTDVTIAMFGERARLRTPLAGRHQAFNLAFSLALLHAAGDRYRFSLAAAQPLLERIALPGRFQRVGKYIFDVAHNADGARVLAETLHAVGTEPPVRVLFCALRDKEWKDMLTTLSPIVDGFVLTDAPTAPASRAWNLVEAGEFLRHIGAKGDVAWTFDEALRRVEDAGTVVVTGSFHTVGDAMARLQVSPFAP
ncbi:MAG: folylpolyglutamate synthase/dihydrofolate synthase family protein [Gemmatimonadaceae bacterium]